MVYQSMWRGLIEVRPPPRLMADILRQVAEEEGVTVCELLAKWGPRKTLTGPRQRAWWMMHEEGRSYSQIGRYFKRHHATIMHGVAGYERGLAMATARRVNARRPLAPNHSRLSPVA